MKPTLIGNNRQFVGTQLTWFTGNAQTANSKLWHWSGYMKRRGYTVQLQSESWGRNVLHLAYNVVFDK